MRRQRLRKTLGLISFLLFPLTIYYFSPYLIIIGGMAGIITGSALVFAALFSLSLFFGRAFCGWICPMGGFQECLSIATDKRAANNKGNAIKYVIWAVWISTIVLLLVRAGGINKTDLLFMTEHGISVTGIEGYMIYYGVLSLVLILALVIGKRSFCHTICWIAPFMVLGERIKHKLKYPSLHIQANPTACTQCKLCTKKCPMGLDVDKMAVSGKFAHSECILCGECVDGCKHAALKYSLKHEKAENSGEPISS